MANLSLFHADENDEDNQKSMNVKQMFVHVNNSKL